MKAKSSRLKLLHLGFEDYRRPGSGGGSARTHEINKRIAKHHDITVLASKFNGYQDRVDDGVNYVHIGLPWGYFGSILTYFAALPFVVRKFDADLIIEDFAAPFSSCLAPLWTRNPVIAMVQWLNAREKSTQYHLPFWIVEKLGLRIHGRYIAVSKGLADDIRTANPAASVDVIGNGVPDNAFRTPMSRKRQDIVYLGRVERAQKGLDLLLDAFNQIKSKTSANLVIAGDGPDMSWLDGQVARRQLASRVRIVGRVEGTEKFKLLASAKVVAMPSRYETFGMVAIEALAAGANVVAFDIACLREVVPPGLGSVVAPFDTTKYANELQTALDAPDDSPLNVRRREFASHYSWDVLANLQQAVYERTASTVQS